MLNIAIVNAMLMLSFAKATKFHAVVDLYIRGKRIKANEPFQMKK